MVNLKPKITIITTVFNGEDYLESTIESVLDCASEINFEYIVINDGSTDKTSDMLNKYVSEIKVINQENIGESASVTKGFKLATGELVMVLSADDPLFTKEIFRNVFELFEKNENLVAVYPDWNLIDPTGKILKKILVPDYSDELLIGKFRTLPGPGVIIRKKAALTIGGRRSKWVYVGDYDFWLRLSRIGEIRHRPQVLAQWREHPNSTSVKRKNFAMASERIAVIEEFVEEFKIDDKLKKMALGNAYYMAARLSYFDPKIPGRKWLMQALRYRGGIPEESKLTHLLFLMTFPMSYKFTKMFRRS
jgi:glycosyltransferase involved in cell wall biosynthesis